MLGDSQARCSEPHASKMFGEPVSETALGFAYVELATAGTCDAIYKISSGTLVLASDVETSTGTSDGRCPVHMGARFTSRTFARDSLERDGVVFNS